MQKNSNTKVHFSNYSLKGKRIALERVSPLHADFILSSFKNTDFWKQYRANQPRNLTKGQLVTNLEREFKVKPEKLRKIEWIVFELNKQQRLPVGFACLADFIPASRKAELLVGIIDNKNKTTGMGLEATLLVMDFAFNKTKLNKLISYVYTENQWAQDNTLALGFQQEGLLREHVWDKKQDLFLSIFQNGYLMREFRANERISKLSRRILGRDITKKSIAQPVRAQPKSDDDWSINVTLDY